VFAAGYARALWVCVVLLALGGVVSWLLVRDPERDVGVAATPADPVSCRTTPMGDAEHQQRGRAN
jgi:hypothetical protein